MAEIRIPDDVVIMLKLHGNTVLPNKFVKKHKTAPILERLREMGYDCRMKVNEYDIPDGKKKQIDIDYVVEVK